MPLISYAQNFEDVMLWRVLRDVANGFYIDVGAQDPLVDSVSKAFYEHGWRGIHVEATHAYASRLREDRPDETVLQAAVNDSPGTIIFFEIPETGLSTGDLQIADTHRSRGYTVLETVVPCITLADVLTRAGQRDIHWLKIDVEGMEPQVLNSWGECAARPWVVVVESTYPNSQVETHQAWEATLLGRGYMFTYFDGLSRYYVSADKADLAPRFATPPNIFDGFSLAPSVPYNGPIRDLIEQKEQTYQVQIAAERINQALELQAAQDTLVEQKSGLLEQIKQVEQVAQASQVQASQREADFLQQIESVRSEGLRLEREQHAVATDMAQEHVNAVDALHQQHAEHVNTAAQRERDLLSQLLAQQQQAQQAAEAHAKATQAVEQGTAQVLAQRDLALQQHVKSAHSEQLRLERDQRAVISELEKKHSKAIEALRQQHAQQLNVAAQQERNLVSQVLQQQQLAKRATEAQASAIQELERSMARALAQRDQQLQQHIDAAKKEVRRLVLGWADKEKSINDQAAKAVQQAISEKIDVLRNQAQHEQYASQQLQAEQLRIRQLQTSWDQREKEAGQSISLLQSEVQDLRRSMHMQGQQHRFELSTNVAEFHRRTLSYEAVHTRIRFELQMKIHTIVSLEQRHSELLKRFETDHVAVAHRSRKTWTFLGKLGRGLAKPPSKQENPKNLPHKQNTSPSDTEGQRFIDELAGLPDIEFLLKAYRSILGREPDPVGRPYYLGRLSSGHSKVSILKQICSSPEAKTRKVDIPGLDDAIKTNWLKQLPFTSRFFKRPKPSQLPNAVTSNIEIEVQPKSVVKASASQSIVEPKAIGFRPIKLRENRKYKLPEHIRSTAKTPLENYEYKASAFPK